MRRFAITAALLIATIGGASAQGIAPNGAVFGQNWALPQDLSTLELTRRAQGSGTAADRATRAARQAQFARNFPGTPINMVASRAR